MNCVHILTNKRNSVIYVEVSSDLVRRIWQHKNRLVKSSCAKYKVDKLIYYEIFDSIVDAIEREKYLKGKKREYKINLIKKTESIFKDLYWDFI